MKRLMGEVQKDPKCELSNPHPVESEHILLPTQEYYHQPEWSTEFWCPEFLLGYHYIGMIE